MLRLRTSRQRSFMRSMGRMCFCSAIGCLLGMLVRGWGLKMDRYSWMITVAGMFFGEKKGTEKGSEKGTEKGTPWNTCHVKIGFLHFRILGTCIFHLGTYIITHYQ